MLDRSKSRGSRGNALPRQTHRPGITAVTAIALAGQRRHSSTCIEIGV